MLASSVWLLCFLIQSRVKNLPSKLYAVVAAAFIPFLTILTHTEPPLSYPHHLKGPKYRGCWLGCNRFTRLLDELGELTSRPNERGAAMSAIGERGLLHRRRDIVEVELVQVVNRKTGQGITGW